MLKRWDARTRSKHHILSVFLSLAVASGLTPTSCTPAPPANDTSEQAIATATQPAADTTEHKEVTLELTGYLEADGDLMAMMVKSIEKARGINPDHDTNPIQGVEDL